MIQPIISCTVHATDSEVRVLDPNNAIRVICDFSVELALANQADARGEDYAEPQSGIFLISYEGSEPIEVRAHAPATSRRGEIDARIEAVRPSNDEGEHRQFGVVKVLVHHGYPGETDHRQAAFD